MKILIYHIGSLGDTLITVPALWVVRETFPDAHITMLTNERSEQSLIQACDILNGSGLVDDYILYPVGNFVEIARLLIQLRIRKFDSLIYLIRAYADDRRIRRDKLFFKLAGIKQSIGMQGICKQPQKSPGNSMSTVPHMADTFLARLAADGLNTPLPGQGRVDINVGEREQENIRQWLMNQPDDGGRGWFALSLGSKMPCKIWPYERYLAISQHLIGEYDLWPVVFGGLEDRSLGQKLVQELGRGYVPAGVLGIRDSIAAMERCLLYIGNDTGTMHMAVASGIRCIALFSSRDFPGLWYPYGDDHIVLRSQIDCEGCKLERCIERKNECLNMIGVEEVYNGCEQMITSLKK